MKKKDKLEEDRKDLLEDTFEYLEEYDGADRLIKAMELCNSVIGTLIKSIEEDRTMAARAFIWDAFSGMMQDSSPIHMGKTIVELD